MESGRNENGDRGENGGKGGREREPENLLNDCRDLTTQRDRHILQRIRAQRRRRGEKHQALEEF